MPDIIFPLSSIGGLAPGYSGAPEFDAPQPNYNVFGSEGQYADGIVNPFRRPGFLGAANNGVQNITHATGTANGIFVSGITEDISSASGVAYFLEKNSGTSQVWRLDGYTDTTLTLANSITTSGGGGTDMALYSLNGTARIFYSYQKAGGGNIGVYDFGTWDDDWLSTLPVGSTTIGSSNNHVFVKSDNGFLYQLDGSFVHKIDGTSSGGVNGTFTANVLSFPDLYQLVDGVDARGYIWIALVGTTRDLVTTDQQTTSENSCGVYVWDRLTSGTQTADFIPIPDAREIRKIFFFDGSVHVITISISRVTQIRRHTASGFEVVAELEREARPRFPKSVHVGDKTVKWLGEDGKMYAYGRVLPGAPLGVFKIGNFSVTNAGSILVAGGRPGVTSGDNLEPETIVVNFNDGVANNISRRWFPNAASVTGVTLSSLGGDYKSLVKGLPKLSRITGVTLVFPTTASGANDAIDFQVYTNRSTTASATATITLNDGARGWYYMPLSKENVNHVQLGISYHTAVAVGDQITPEFAILHFESTGKKL